MRNVLAMIGLASLAAFVSISAPAQPTADTVDKSKIIRDFVAAFNAHDEAAMAQFVTHDVQWLSVIGDSVSKEVEGRAPLAAAMSEYFKSCPSCRSEIGGLLETGSRACAVEVAHWAGSDGHKSQKSMAVYEFSGPLIQRVYYFPAE